MAAGQAPPQLPTQLLLFAAMAPAMQIQPGNTHVLRACPCTPSATKSGPGFFITPEEVETSTLLSFYPTSHLLSPNKYSQAGKEICAMYKVLGEIRTEMLVVVSEGWEPMPGSCCDSPNSTQVKQHLPKSMKPTGPTSPQEAWGLPLTFPTLLS